MGLDSVSKPGRLYATLLSNRAQALLYLDMPGSSLRDSDAALLDPSLDDAAASNLKEKLLLRAATAQSRLQRFPSTVARCEELVRLAPTSKEGLVLLDQAKIACATQKICAYDWVKLFGKSLFNDSIDAPDYVGSMFEVAEIKGKGNGLVATRDIARGRCLMVCAPIAFGKGDPKRLSYTVGANLFTSTMDPYAHNDLVALLIERIIDDPTNYPRLLELTGGKDFPPIPSYPIPCPSPSCPLSIDTSRLEGIATFNAFHTDPLARKQPVLSPSEERQANIHAPSSLYHMPSFMNHSCLGNVTYTFIGTSSHQLLVHLDMILTPFSQRRLPSRDACTK